MIIGSGILVYNLWVKIFLYTGFAKGIGIRYYNLYIVSFQVQKVLKY